MSREEIITGLTDTEAGGLAWGPYGRDSLRGPGAFSLLAGRSLAGSQLFTSEGRCGEAAGVDPTMGRRVGGDRR